MFLSVGLSKPEENPHILIARHYTDRASLVAQWVKNLPATQETRIRSLGQEDPLEKKMATHSGTLAGGIPWTEEAGRRPSTGSHRVGHDWATKPPAPQMRVSLSFGALFHEAVKCDSGEGLPWALAPSPLPEVPKPQAWVVTTKPAPPKWGLSSVGPLVCRDGLGRRRCVCFTVPGVGGPLVRFPKGPSVSPSAASANVALCTPQLVTFPKALPQLCSEGTALEAQE